MADIRVDTKFFQHPKTMKLLRHLGAEGVVSLFRLWLWAAENRPTGYLHGLREDDIDLIAAAGQTRPDQADLSSSLSFCQEAKELGWIDEAEDGTLRLHEWEQYNPWVADAPSRSDKARFSKLASVAPAAYFQMAQEGRNSITAEEYRAVVEKMGTKRRRTVNEAPAENNGGSAPSPSPSPSPVIDRSDPRDNLLRLYHSFPGYRADLREKELVWIDTLLARFPDINILEEIEKAKTWTELKAKEGDFNVKSSRAYIIKWLERVQKERI